MTALSTTIKQRYFDAIVKGTKATEFKATSPFWRKRIERKGLELDTIVFLCGRQVHRRQITLISNYKNRLEFWNY
jgi:hypothetical protein